MRRFSPCRMTAMTVTLPLKKPYGDTHIIFRDIFPHIYTYVCVISVIVSYSHIFRGFSMTDRPFRMCHQVSLTGGAV